MVLNIFGHAKTRKDEQRRADLHRALLHYEARLGGELFGPVPKDGRREFFCLDRHTWVWHEEWVDEHGERQVMTTRYDVRPSGIVKSQGNNTYQMLSREEVQNFAAAVRLYGDRVGSELERIAQQLA